MLKQKSKIMKKTRLIILTLFLAVSSISMSSVRVAQVVPKSFLGHPVFIMCEPETPYYVVKQISSEGMVSFTCPEIDKISEYYVNSAMKSKIDFDAICYMGGKEAQAIKFK